MRKGSWDRRGEVLRRKQFLPELQPFWGEWSGCFGHELQAIRIGDFHALLIHRGRTQVAELVTGNPAVFLEQIPLQLGREKRHRHSISLLHASVAACDGRAVAGAATVAVAAGVALPMLAVAAVVVDSERVGGLEEAGGGGEGRGL